MQIKSFAPLLTLSLIGCSGHSLIPSQEEQVSIDSVPTGASVIILGESVGQTPLTVDTRAIFPRQFDHKKQHLYGRIQLQHPGCEPYMAVVSSRVISNGLKARMKCRSEITAITAVPAISPQATPTSTPAPVTKDIKSRLRQLKELRDDGLISEDDYTSKKQELLKEL